MDLSQVKNQEDFEKFYKEKNIRNVNAKIAFLKENLGIICSRGEPETPQEELQGLEDLVLSHIWEAFRR